MHVSAREKSRHGYKAVVAGAKRRQRQRSAVHGLHVLTSVLQSCKVCHMKLDFTASGWLSAPTGMLPKLFHQRIKFLIKFTVRS